MIRLRFMQISGSGAGVMVDASRAASTMPVPEVSGAGEGQEPHRRTATSWPISGGGDRFRRGLYVALWRGTPYYALTVFDGGGREADATVARVGAKDAELKARHEAKLAELESTVAAEVERMRAEHATQLSAAQATVSRRPAASRTSGEQTAAGGARRALRPSLFAGVHEALGHADDGNDADGNDERNDEGH